MTVNQKPMSTRTLLGGVFGSVITLTFSLGSQLLWNNFSLDFLITIRSFPLGLLIMLMAPFGGGFLAGMIGKDNPRKAGLMGGLGASLVVVLTWSLYAGSWEAVINSLVIGFIWMFLSHLGARFSSSKR